MRAPIVLLLAVLVSSVFILSAMAMDTSWLNASISASHPAKYLTPFNRPGTFTINYTKIPRQFQGVTPKLKTPTDLQLDTIRRTAVVKLDPRTCPNDLAFCYQVLEHNQTKTVDNKTRGANYSALAAYTLPAARVRQYLCVGNDTRCVQESTNCFCPTEKLPSPPRILGEDGKCTAASHMCRNTYGTFTMCAGNLTWCKQRYDDCGCGPYAACVSGRNTCLNNRNEMVLCKGALADCLRTYPTCYCGPDMLIFQDGCTTEKHTCVKNNKTFVCRGTFASCALGFDQCDC